VVAFVAFGGFTHRSSPGPDQWPGGKTQTTPRWAPAHRRERRLWQGTDLCRRSSKNLFTIVASEGQAFLTQHHARSLQQIMNRF